MTDILVVGGAGYIGAHMCKLLAQQGYRPVVLDNLIYGHRAAVKWGPLEEGDLDDLELLDRIFTKYDIKVVMHFAAFAYVGESVTNPGKYYQNNFVAPLKLLDKMLEHGVRHFVFSSTCATYGIPKEFPITEDHPQNPINPYGNTKLMLEKVLKDYADAGKLCFAILRYFNAAGADMDGEIGENHDPETHLIPLAIAAMLGHSEELKVFGDDYDTPDGTCIRDYIHVSDLADAHLLVLKALLTDDQSRIYNLGNGNGYSVLEVLHSIEKVSGKKVPYRVVERRTGDPAMLVGSSKKIIRELGWQARYPTIDVIVESALKWHQSGT